MENKLLNGLGQMHINKDINIEVDEVINTFTRKNPTHMQFLNILDDDEKHGK